MADQHNRVLDAEINKAADRVAKDSRENGPENAMSEIIMVRTEALIFRGTKGQCMQRRNKWAKMMTAKLPTQFEYDLINKGHISVGEKMAGGEVHQHYTIANVTPKQKEEEKKDADTGV